MTDTEAILLANDAFYRALSLADLPAMTRVWLTAPEAVCAHPGGSVLYGWSAIHASWASIFKNQGPLHVWATEASARLYGETAEVTCLENIDAGLVSGAGILQTRATNVFRRVGADWKILEHHALVAEARAPQRLEPFSAN